MNESDYLSDALSESEDLGEPVDNLPNVEGMEIDQPDESAKGGSVAALQGTTAAGVPPTPAQPPLDNFQQVANVLKQTMSGGIMFI